MTPKEYQTIAGKLLEKHYGITLNDTGLQEEKTINRLIFNDVRPYEAVNFEADENDLNRIDKTGSFGTPSQDQLTINDEKNIIESISNQKDVVIEKPRPFPSRPIMRPR